jgi:hypothetical protein
MRGCLEVTREVWWRGGDGGKIVSGGNGGEEGCGGEERSGKRGGRVGGKKLSGKLERGTISCLRRRLVGGFSWGGAETEENPGEVMVPVGGGGSGAESRF